MQLLRNNFLSFIDVIRASFISLVPYYVLYSLIILSVELQKQFHFYTSILTLEGSFNCIELMKALLPLLLNLTITYHLVTGYYTRIDRLLTIILSLIIYLSVELLVHNTNINHYFLPESIILAMLVPFCTTWSLSQILKLLKQYEKKLSSLLTNNIVTIIIYIIPFALTFFILTFILTTFHIYTYIETSFSLTHLIDQGVLLFLRTLVSSFIWFFGIHGVNFFDTIVDASFLKHFMFPNFTYEEFFNTFIVLGGSGAGLSLAIAILLFSKDKHTSFIGKMSLPFVVFNINEILIFGIPVFMNLTLIIPFILVPCINFILSYLLLSYTDFITFSSGYIPWTTPALFNAYFSTDGNFLAVLFQLGLIVLGTLIYIPFIKRYTHSQSSTALLDKMSRKYNITTSIEAQKSIKFQEAQSLLINAHYKVNKIVDTINQNNLLLYYQPKIDIKKHHCNHFEVLLRVKQDDGSITGPTFILDIENSGLAPILDIWVCKGVKKDLDTWAEAGFYPHVCINLFPHTLEDANYTEQIIDTLKGYTVGFEIIERRSALNQNILNNLQLLKENGFKISLDDLGVGYTNFSMLYELPLDIVKIDKRVIAFTQTQKGLKLYTDICQLCANMNLEIVLEGVETQEEYDRLINPYVSYIQGWYYSKAIPFDEIQTYSKNFNQKQKKE